MLNIMHPEFECLDFTVSLSVKLDFGRVIHLLIDLLDFRDFQKKVFLGQVKVLLKGSLALFLDMIFMVSLLNIK